MKGNGGYIDGQYVSWLGRNAVFYDSAERQRCQALQDEWNYRYTERLGILCEDRKPTELEREIARKEADEWVRENQR